MKRPGKQEQLEYEMDTMLDLIKEAFEQLSQPGPLDMHLMHNLNADIVDANAAINNTLQEK